jgi:NAD-dependent dihydropyrimidine dehydrogenase PreA subunit
MAGSSVSCLRVASTPSGDTYARYAARWVWGTNRLMYCGASRQPDLSAVEGPALSAVEGPSDNCARGCAAARVGAAVCAAGRRSVQASTARAAKARVILLGCELPFERFEDIRVAYIITEPCIGTKDTACVDVCPVDCIHPRKDEPEFQSADMLYIHPDECIDCGACVPACPVEAIFTLDETPRKWEAFIARNADYYVRA